MSGGSVERVKAALAASGHDSTIDAFPAGTRSAAEAANAARRQPGEAKPADAGAGV